MSGCTLKHDEEGTIPPFLCRQCRPELNRQKKPAPPVEPICEEVVEW